ncbi:MAG: hypothetical protein LUD77_04905 [Clostridiales bacterium]|nr:hypothetical protein [Clostridiales bacterium]
MENNITENSLPAINEEIISLMTVQRNITKNEICRYAGFYDNLIDDEDKSLLNDILIVKNKHLKMLDEMYYRFKGERFKPETESPEKKFSKGFISSELKKAILGELENTETYRSLMADFLNQSVRNAFSELTADSQNNAPRFVLLLIKYS